MTRIILAGGGGFGLELYGYLQQDLASGRLGGHTLAGVLDDGADCELLSKTPDANYLGAIRDYRPQAEDRIAHGCSPTSTAPPGSPHPPAWARAVWCVRTAS